MLLLLLQLKSGVTTQSGRGRRLLTRHAMWMLTGRGVQMLTGHLRRVLRRQDVGRPQVEVLHSFLLSGS